jgi:hypothetical protein
MPGERYCVYACVCVCLCACVCVCVYLCVCFREKGEKVDLGERKGENFVEFKFLSRFFSPSKNKNGRACPNPTPTPTPTPTPPHAPLPPRPLLRQPPQRSSLSSTAPRPSTVALLVLTALHVRSCEPIKTKCKRSKAVSFGSEPNSDSVSASEQAKDSQPKSKSNPTPYPCPSYDSDR